MSDTDQSRLPSASTDPRLPMNLSLRRVLTETLPDGRQYPCRRDLVACHHHGGKSTCDRRRSEHSWGAERPKVGRSAAEGGVSASV